MSRTRVKLRDRFLAALLSVLMIFAMIPVTTLQAFAATAEYPNHYTVTVTDGENPVEGAQVALASDMTGFELNLQATTDTNGIAAFDATALEEAFNNSSYDGTPRINITVQKDGYEQEVQTWTLLKDDITANVLITIDKVAIPQATVSVNITGSGNATVEIDGVVQNSKAVNVGTEVPIKITPDEGCYIKEIDDGQTKINPSSGSYYCEFLINANTTYTVTVVKEVTVTANAGEGGSILLDEVSVSSKTVDAGTLMKITAKAEEGYQIASMKIGNADVPNVFGKTEFSSDSTVNNDLTVTATFVKVYTVTVNHNENGSIEIVEPATVGGAVTVENGTDVKIKATPEANYRVSDVKINGTKDDSVTGANSSGYEKTLTANKDYTVVITFAPNTFAITKGQTENGTISLGSESVDYNGSCNVIVTPDDGYSVTSVKVNGTDIGMYETENGSVKFTIANITEAQNVEATFAVTAKDNYNIEDLFNHFAAVYQDGMTYVYPKNERPTFYTYSDKIILYSGNNQVAETIGGMPVALDASTKITKIELVYQANNEMAVMPHEVIGVSVSTPLNLVIDKTATESTLTPNDANQNGYYNSDVTFAVKAEDKGDFSGISLVEYWITLNGLDGQKVTLYEYVDSEAVKNIHEDSIVVNALTYNSKDVKVTLRVLDRAGNEEIVEKTIKINSTKPTISLAIDGTQNDNAQEGYYNDKRALTITVIDREDTFSQTNVAAGLKIYKDGTLVDVSVTDITWKHTAGSNQYEGTYVFADDAHYEWSFGYTNIAGLSNDGVTVDANSKDIYEFYVDKAEPYSLAINYNPNFIGVLLDTITFGFYGQDFIEVTVEAIDDTAGIEQFEYTYGNVTQTISGTAITRDGDKASATFSIPAQFRGSVSVKATDRAGRSAELADDKVVVIDTIAPGVIVTWSPAQGYNGKYFNTDRTATIEIEEANFFAQDVEDGLLNITAHIVYNDGSSKDETYKPTFTFENGKYVAAITFSEEADYTFDIIYTDRSGNVYDAYPAEEFTIDKTAPVILLKYDNNSVVNENQFKVERTATITVVEHNFFADDMVVTVNGSEYAVTWNPVAGEADNYTAEVPFPGDAHYSFAVTGKDFADNADNGVTEAPGTVAPWAFTVDKSGPEDLKISYQPTFVGTLLEGLTFGFYKAPVTVKIEATDDISGIDYFTYSYIVQDGASVVNVGKENVKVEVNGENYITFDIEPQFRGYVYFTATNNAGVSASTADTNAVVVDNIAPGVNVVYGNYDALNDKYYKADRTATITINEANFFAQDIEDGLLVITRKAVANNGTITEETLAPTFNKSGDVYTTTIKFDQDADYTFDIAYTDRAGNAAADYTADVFTVDKIAPVISIEKANGAYFNADRTAKITVVEHNFRASDFEFFAEAYDVTGNTMIDLSSKGYQNYLKNQDNWTLVAADTWEAVITFDIEGNYLVGATYTDLAGNPQVSEIEDTFCVDKQDADKNDPNNLKITYKPTFVGTLLETLTFGFYQAPVEVTIEVTDDIAGVDYFVYSYAVQAGASNTNVGKINQRVAATRDGSTNRWYATFMIEPQFRGKVSFTAYDKATNHAFLADEKYVIVDNVAPGINVVYDNMSDYDDEFYKADRTATITITEANFFERDIEDGLLVITVEKTLNNGDYTSTNMAPTFSKNGDVYTATIPFTEEADYTFDIKYTDRSGNVYDAYEKDVFTIDKTAPVIEVSYNNNSAKNNDQFKANRVATIKVTEHNFRADYVVAKVMASGTEVASYAEYLKNDANWTHNGDIHTAVIEYNEEAHYTFEIACTDKAGNISGAVNYGESVAPTAFTLDKSVPTNMDIKIADVSVKGSMTTHAFDTFYGAAVTVKLSADCEISGRESFKYQKVADVSEYNENGTWLDYDYNNGIVVNPSEKFVIYFRAEDRAGNVDIIRSTGIVVDDQMPVGETNAPEIDILPAAPNANKLHKADVRVDLKVVDPKYAGSAAAANGHYSGLKKITYKIYTTDTEAIEEGTLLDLASKTEGAVFDADNLVSSWSGKITIDSEKFNSNNVIVEVVAVDNAGNERKTTTTAGDIQIDITAPTIVVTYDNNTADSDTFFKNDRTATVVITERNFKAENVVFTITNTDGVMPTISAFTKNAGTGNGDDTTWTATIKYTADGDYEFDVAYTDQADNACSGETFAEGTVASNAFTIDHTAPVVTVTYDNNSALNTNYYKDARVATIVITEHNLDPNGVDKNRVVITMTATDDGKETTIPAVSAWKTEGDKHTATIHYSADALYSFDVAIKDKAGNDSADFAAQTFYVDKTAPTLSITGVENNSANNGDVIPVISYSDTNYDADEVTITLTGANRKNVELDGSYTDIHNGRTFTFKNFAEEKEIDDIYTLTATLTDKAGNTSEQTITFSVNRFGSTYAMSESAEKLNSTYVKEPVDVVLSETNANELKNIKITLFKNNETIVLSEGTDYKTDVTGGNGEWYHYTYTVFAKNFADDGVYRLTFHSEDVAGNVAENTLDTKDTEIGFGVDATNPNIVIANLENGITYALENMTVNMSISDNLLLSSISVYLDNYNMAYKTWNAEEIVAIIAENGDFTFDIAGDSTSAHKVKIVAVDAAGNEQVEEITDFFVTTDIWVRYYNNKPLFFGSIAGVIVLAGLIVFLVVYKRKKKENK